MTAFAIKSDEDFGDAVDALKGLLPEKFPELAPVDPDDPSSFRVGTVWPDNVFDRLPVVRLTSIGGNDDGLTDYPLIDIDVLHYTRAQAKQLARRIRAFLLSYPHWYDGVLIKKVRTAMRPHPVPWDDQRIARYYGSYVAEVPR